MNIYSKKSINPSDYIMSSLDMANAIELDHLAMLDVINDCIESGAFEDKGYFDILPYRVKNKTSFMFLLDLDAVIKVCDVLSSYGGDYDAKAIILKRFFELAHSGSIVSIDAYFHLSERLTFNRERQQIFANSLWACASVKTTEEKVCVKQIKLPWDEWGASLTQSR